jgi:DNA repair exonuclease SbcCD ATPase subunit|tara:strand:- start:1170 stop:2090 length:921 start_codon:yes stop_codon:yes gene_type:complete
VSTNAAEEQEIEVIEEEEKEQQQELELEESAPAVEEQSESEVEEKSEPDKEEELEQYSKSVQNRINKLTHKFREEEAQRKAAVEFAEAVKKQNDDLKSRLDKLDESFVGEFGSRIESQIAAAKSAYQKAYDEGDAEAMFEAQKSLSKLALDEARLDETKQRREKAPQQAPQEQQQRAPQQAQQAAPPPPDPKAEVWATKNEWFGSDQTMTYAAFGLHRQLIEDEGFDPASDEYYNELDKRIRIEFPQKFKETKRGDKGPRVASAESSASKAPSGKGRRTVKLTASQIAIAKRLNVPLEEYAKYVKE